jgi:hypothetical protein
MSERTDRMIEALVPWEREDPNVIAVQLAVGRELDEVEALMQAVRDQAWPHRADDTYGLLALHERTLGLPSSPVGQSIAQRQQAVKTRFGRRRDGRKTTWVDRINEVIGVGNWSYQVNTPGDWQLTITLRVDPASGLAEQTRLLAEAFTPAVIEVLVGFEAGFILGVGSLGEDLM